MAPVPEDFMDLTTVSDKTIGTRFNVIGMVCDMLPPKDTPQGTKIFTFHIVDLSTQHNNIGHTGFRVRFFCQPTGVDFPKITQTGDIVLLRDVKMSEYAGHSLLVNIPGLTRWSVFPIAGMPKGDFALAYMGGKQKLRSSNSRNHNEQTTLSLLQQNYILELAKDCNKLLAGFTSITNFRMNAEHRLPTHPSAEKRIASIPDLNWDGRKRFQAARADRLRLISDIRNFTYCDLIVEVVKKWSGLGGCELYVTDYTKNELLWDFRDPLNAPDGAARDGDPYSYTDALATPWPGPWGPQVLKVVCKHPHRDFANASVQVGQHIRLLNPKIELNERNLLEGTLWEDRKYPEKICITILRGTDLPEVKDLIERKTQYYAARDDVAKSRALTTAPDTDEKSLKKMSKNQKKRKKTAEARAVEQSLQEQALKTNEHVRCSHMNVALSSVKTILDTSNKRHLHRLPDGRPYVLPFINANFRTKVRVLDFKPDNLEDFAIVTDEMQDNSMDLSIESSQRWKWSFTLLVQDATKLDPQNDDCILVNVGHKEAEFMFLPDAANLKEHPELLSKLREKMCILWGDLEERKTTDMSMPPSNRPFECCISEYGLLKDGGLVENVLHWERQYMLHGVTIQ